jgi:hypothetical protein
MSKSWRLMGIRRRKGWGTLDRINKRRGWWWWWWWWWWKRSDAEGNVWWQWWLLKNAWWRSFWHRNVIIAVNHVIVIVNWRRTFRHNDVIIAINLVITGCLVRSQRSLHVRHSWRGYTIGIHDSVIVDASFRMPRQTMFVENISFLLDNRFLFVDLVLVSTSSVNKFTLFRMLLDIFFLLSHDFV